MTRAPCSRHLVERQLRALARVGDCLVPGDEDLPAFSRCGCLVHVDRILDHLPADDRAALGTVLRLLGLAPGFAVRWLLSFLEADFPLPDMVAAPLRYLRLGLRGVVFSLYFSGAVGDNYTGPSPLEVLGYQVGVYTGDVEHGELAETTEIGENPCLSSGSRVTKWQNLQRLRRA
jgi:hypothetical protein